MEGGGGMKCGKGIWPQSLLFRLEDLFDARLCPPADVEGQGEGAAALGADWVGAGNSFFHVKKKKYATNHLVSSCNAYKLDACALEVKNFRRHSQNREKLSAWTFRVQCKKCRQKKCSFYANYSISEVDVVRNANSPSAYIEFTRTTHGPPLHHKPCKRVKQEGGAGSTVLSWSSLVGKAAKAGPPVTAYVDQTHFPDPTGGPSASQKVISPGQQMKGGAMDEHGRLPPSLSPKNDFANELRAKLSPSPAVDGENLGARIQYVPFMGQNPMMATYIQPGQNAAATLMPLGYGLPGLPVQYMPIQAFPPTPLIYLDPEARRLLGPDHLFQEAGQAGQDKKATG